MSEECGAVKHGVVDLRCSEERGHDEPTQERPATWHEAVYVSRHEVDYPGAHHVVNVTETVTWEPVDHAAEASRHILAIRRAKPLPASHDDAEPAPDYRALVDKSTAAHWNVGLPGEQEIANAHRREAGLEEL